MRRMPDTKDGIEAAMRRVAGSGESSASPTCSTADVVTDGMHIRAMKKAVELGVFPKQVDEGTCLKNWSAMREILEAALSR